MRSISSNWRFRWLLKASVAARVSLTLRRLLGACFIGCAEQLTATLLPRTPSRLWNVGRR
jgi:hypothetical protein